MTFMMKKYTEVSSDLCFPEKSLGWFRSKWNNMQNRDNSNHNLTEIDENLDIDSGDQSRKLPNL